MPRKNQNQVIDPKFLPSTFEEFGVPDEIAVRLRSMGLFTMWHLTNVVTLKESRYHWKEVRKAVRKYIHMKAKLGLT